MIRAEPGEPMMIPLVVNLTVSAPRRQSRLLSYGDVLYFLAHTLGIYLCPVHCRDLLQLLLAAWALVQQTLHVFCQLFLAVLVSFRGLSLCTLIGFGLWGRRG